MIQTWSARGTGALLWTLGVSLATSAVAADPKAEQKVEVEATVVRMSNQGTAVDPALAAMKETFSKQGFQFTSYQRLSGQKVTLEQGKPAEVAVPQQAKAVLRLHGLEQNTAVIAVKIGAVDATYRLGREGSVFINFAKDDEGGVLVLVLAPSTAKK